MKRLTIVLVLMLLVGTACNATKAPEKTSTDLGPPVSGDWAIIRYEAEPDTLNPITYSSSLSAWLMWGINNSQIYELLMGYNTKDWTLTEPILVEGPPSISDDHLTYTFV